MIRALAAYCGTQENFFTGMAGNCDELYLAAMNGNGAIIKTVLRRLRPREVVQSARTSVEIISTQQANVATRMAQVRAGVGNSLTGLNIENNGVNIPVSLLTYLNEDDTNSDNFSSPWGLFINGQISSGDYTYSDAGDEGFDFDTNGITLGMDYRFNSKTVAGIALGYADFDSNIADDAQMQSTAVTFSAYGSFSVNSNFYVDARASYGRPEFNQTRSIYFNIEGNQTDKTAIGETDGTQQSVILSTGYQFNSNGWQITPNASLEYSKTQVDAFVETQAAAWNVGFSEQNFKTTRFTAGLQANKAISLSNGVIIPSAGYQYIHENQHGDDFILMRISGMPAGEFFQVSTDFNDNDYSSANIGLTFVGSNGKQAYLQYAEVFGWDGFDRGTLNLGARFEF